MCVGVSVLEIHKADMTVHICEAAQRRPRQEGWEFTYRVGYIARPRWASIGREKQEFT